MRKTTHAVKLTGLLILAATAITSHARPTHTGTVATRTFSTEALANQFCTLENCLFVKYSSITQLFEASYTLLDPDTLPIRDGGDDHGEGDGTV